MGFHGASRSQAEEPLCCPAGEHFRPLPVDPTCRETPMPILHKFAALVAHPLVRATCQVLNLETAHFAVEAVSGYLRERFTDHSQRLAEALQRATDRAWRTLELALAGKSFTQRLARTEDA